MSQVLKTCKKCIESIPIDKFRKNSNTCKSCVNEKTREQYHKKKQDLLRLIEEKGSNNIIITCGCCKENKSADLFDNCFKSCKDCNKKKNQEMHKKKKEIQLEKGYSYDFEKKCYSCQIVKQGTEFTKNCSYCKECNKTRLHESYLKFRETRIQNNREYRKKRVEQDIKFETSDNKRTCKTCNQELNIDKFSICGGNFLQTICNGCRAINNKEYRNTSEKYKEYLDKNKIIFSCRSRIHSLIKKNNRISRKEMIGCDHNLFKDWLQFVCTKYKYDYNLYGTQWELDHIIPCNSFDLENKEEQIICFHWTNMAPLESSLNSSKRDKIILSQVKDIQTFLEEFIQENNLDKEIELKYWNDFYLPKIENYAINKIKKTFRINKKSEC